MATTQTAVERALSILYPGDNARPEFDTLSGALDASSTSFSVAGRLGADGIPDSGVLEIDSELILVSSVSTLAVTVEAAGRGWLESTATTHASGAKVYLDPDYPRIRIFNAIADIVTSLYAHGIYVRAQDTTGTFSTQTDYTVPTGGKDVISISVSLAGGVRRMLRKGVDYEVWKDTTGSPEVQFASGAANGNALRVIYKKDFVAPTTEADDLTTTCLVPATLVPHIPYAAAGMMLMTKEPSRTQIEHISRLMESQNVPLGAVTSVGQSLVRQFEAAVARERKRLREQDGIQITRRRRA